MIDASDELTRTATKLRSISHRIRRRASTGTDALPAANAGSALA
ncbi:hypothetical protein ACQEVB_35085 [Pseudonocardia sp. CA-107938]